MDKVIYLLEAVNSTNQIGDPIKTLTKRKRYAQTNSIRQSEVYQAGAVGLKPEIMFEIWAFEYNQEQFLEYNGKNYKIIRTYKRNDEKIELTCISVANSEVNAYGNT